MLVATGYPSNQNTQSSEIINVFNSSLTCSNLEPYPRQVRGAFGEVLCASDPIICGGFLHGNSLKTKVFSF